MPKVFIVLSTALLLSCNDDLQSKLFPKTKEVAITNPTKEKTDRRKRSEDYCQKHEVPVYKNPNALFTDPESQIVIRTKDEIVDRALALCYIGLKSEGFKKDILEKVEERYTISSKLTPSEKSYVNSISPTEQQTTDANWRYESLHVMLWALGFVDSLTFPDKICKVEEDTRSIRNHTEAEFRQKARLRSKKEILDQADLILRLNWACTNARIKNEPAPGHLDYSVVYERHYAFNWLIRYLDQNWDDVSTDT